LYVDIKPSMDVWSAGHSYLESMKVLFVTAILLMASTGSWNA
jgi:hypothetical protein